MSESRVVGAVEIGTSKVVVLLGEIIDGEGLNIIGHSMSSSYGVKKGVVDDLGVASDSVHAAIMEAEKNAQSRIDEVYLAQTGSHLSGSFNVGTTSVSGPDNIVSETDIFQAKEDAKRRQLPADRAYLHHIQNPFSLDGRKIDNPLSREGRQLQVGYWSVHAESSKVSDSLRVIRGIDLEVTDIIISSIASGAVLLEDSEKESGALVVDIGGGTTDYVLYRGGYIVKTGVVPVGGDHITNDLSIGLRISPGKAEKFKRIHGRAYYESGDREKNVWLTGDPSTSDLTIGDREYPLAAITKIIEARVSEIFEIIKKELEDAELYQPDDIACGVVLTGGSSQLNGIEESVRRVLGLEARVSDGPRDVAPELRHPAYSTALGLLHYALTGQEDRETNPPPNRFLRKIARLFNFD